MIIMIMKNLKTYYFLVFSCLLFSFANGQSKQKINNQKDKGLVDSTYDIEFTIKPYQNEKFYLLCYYGKTNAIIDSCVVNSQSVGHFKGNKKLVGGIYPIVNKNFNLLLDIIIGDEQHFSVKMDTTSKKNPVITGSTENDLFKEYNLQRSELEKPIVELSNKLKDAKTKSDSAIITNDIKAKARMFTKYRDEFIQLHHTSLVATLLHTDKTPDVPEIPVDPVTKKADSAYPFHYVKEHYWDDVNFADNRLLRTPFFEKKIDNYLKYYISPEADSIIPEVKYMLLSARESKEMYPYLLIKFTNKYISPEYMGQEKVFVTLFLECYLKGDTVYLDSKSRKTIIDRGYHLLWSGLNSPAQPLNLTDTSGKIVSLYDVKAKFTFIAYWSPTCGHCKQEIPVLDSIYKAKWKDLGIKVYSIISDYNQITDFKSFVKEKDLSRDWLYVYETKEAREAVAKSGEVPFTQAYDFIQTPVFYLLDVNKKIIGKNLNIHQFDEMISRKLK